MSSADLLEWSRQVRARDGCCTECGSTKALVAHHIKGKSTHPELKFDLLNGTTLCSNCHIEHHKANRPIGQRSAKQKVKQPNKEERRFLRTKKVASLIEKVRNLEDQVGRLQAEVQRQSQILQEYESAMGSAIGSFYGLTKVAKRCTNKHADRSS